jgi:DNA-binding YbaB/EbfC family protein
MPQPNMQQMFQQVQKMQADLAKAQEELKHETVQATAGGGAVTVEVTGELIFKSLKIAPEAIDPDDAEMLSDLVLAAVNQGLQAAQELAAQKLGAATGGLGDLAGPGGLGGLGLPGF